jgi:hypothetical protein
LHLRHPCNNQELGYCGELLPVEAVPDEPLVEEPFVVPGLVAWVLGLLRVEPTGLLTDTLSRV